jgi:phosphoenolpyruvate phosphomutase
VNDRPAQLRQLLAQDGVIRAIGVSDGLGARLAERAGFEALWASGFAISASHGVPDAGILTMKEMLDAAVVISDASALPVIADCDTGFGDVSVVARMVQSYERRGIAAVCIEDKCFPKRNSFRPGQHLADAGEFAAKIEAAVAARTDPDFCVIARLESLIAGHGLDDAVERGEMYAHAGADVVLIHSKARSAVEIEAFAARWRRAGQSVPLAIVPTSYPDIEIDDLDEGVKIVIYANQLVRASVRAAQETLRSIATTGSTKSAEAHLGSMREIFEVTDTGAVEELEAWFEGRVRDWHGDHVTSQDLWPREAGR